MVINYIFAGFITRVNHASNEMKKSYFVCIASDFPFENYYFFPSNSANSSLVSL